MSRKLSALTASNLQSLVKNAFRSSGHGQRRSFQRFSINKADGRRSASKMVRRTPSSPSTTATATTSTTTTAVTAIDPPPAVTAAAAAAVVVTARAVDC